VYNKGSLLTSTVFGQCLTMIYYYLNSYPGAQERGSSCHLFHSGGKQVLEGDSQRDLTLSLWFLAVKHTVERRRLWKPSDPWNLGSKLSIYPIANHTCWGGDPVSGVIHWTKVQSSLPHLPANHKWQGCISRGHAITGHSLGLVVSEEIHSKRVAPGHSGQHHQPLYSL
jgi:hypothetical protein